MEMGLHPRLNRPQGFTKSLSVFRAWKWERSILRRGNTLDRL